MPDNNTYDLYQDVQTGERCWFRRNIFGMWEERDGDMKWTPEEFRWMFEKVQAPKQ